MNSKNKRMKTLPLLLAVLLLLVPSSSGKAQKQIQKEYKHAIQFVGSRQYDKAVQAFRRIIQKEPGFYRAYIKLASVYKEKNCLDTAALYFKGLTERYPDNPYAYYGLGLVYKEQKLYDKATEEMQRALQLYSGQPEIFEDMVDAFQRSKRLDSAQAYITGILEKNPGNAAAYFGQAQIYRLQNNWKQSLEMLERAIKLKPDMYQAYFLKGWIYVLRIAEFQKALPVLKAGIKYAEAKYDFEYRAKLLRINGGAHYRLGNYPDAYRLCNEAIKVFEMTGDRKWIETVLGDIGLFYFDIGDYVNSEKYLSRAYEIAREIKDKADQARHLNNLGNIVNYMGKYPEALDYFARALAIDRETGNEWGEENRLGNIADLYFNLGNYQRAKEYANQALILARKIGDRRSEAIYIADLGRIYMDLNENEKALEFLKEAIKKSKEIDYQLVETNSLEFLGDYYFNLNNYDKAKEYYDQALVQAVQNEDKRLKGYTLNNLGRINYKQGNYSESADYHRKALDIGESLEEINIVIDAHVGLAHNYKYLGKYNQAISHYQSVAEKIENVRSELKTEEHKLSYLESKSGVYEKLIDLFSILHSREHKKGYDRVSFEYAEKAKARTLLDIVSQGKIFSNLSEIPDAFKQKFLINEKKIEKSHLELSQELSKPEDKRDKKIILARNSELESLQRSEAQLLEEVKSKYPRYYQLTNPKILLPKDIQRNILKNDQVLVEYLVGEENTFVWIVTRKEFVFKTIHISRKELESMLVQISPIFAKGKTNKDVVVDHRWANFNSNLLNKLYNILLKSPAEEFLGKNTELVIVPDGILHYLPFEILVTEYNTGKEKYLIEEYPVSYSSSASMLNPELKRTGKAGRNLLAFGNPSYTDENKGIFDWVSNLDPLKIILRNNKFESLPSAELEVRAIAGSFEDAAVYIGKDATEVQFKKLAGDFRCLHLAAHYLSSNEQPMYSKIVLAPTENEDGFLQTYEVYNLKLNADLVVLSGCSTGLGKLSRGEGLIGMSRAFLHAGVPSVLVSLWPVEDASTAQFMSNFYWCLKKGMSKSRALQQAKIEMLRSGDVKQNPFYWSPFVLIGDSKGIKIK